MITIRRSDDRGHADRGWLQSHHTFTFGSYHDPAFMGFRALRVLNEDTIAAGKGFGPHAHRDMEIITYVLEGTLAHRDSMNERHTLGPNEVQTMSAGDGVVHSEFNASESEPVHLTQIWIEPAAEDLPPSYQQVAFAPEEKRGRLRLLAAPHGTAVPPGATLIHQDARVFVTELGASQQVEHRLDAGRHAWAQVVRGAVSLNGQRLSQGDGAAVSDESSLVISGEAASGGEVLLFDLP
jgi:redox-sensitive bicupin YhaK (pirin superfamily)